ncbi:cell wall hydrolase [Qipengyuania sp. JC766]|uniref:cell wall hydrolase n=1 Tax=Qipengyuania sp. JC766 TaxID=3232139 RepID=UPI0034595D41
MKRKTCFTGLLGLGTMAFVAFGSAEISDAHAEDSWTPERAVVESTLDTITVVPPVDPALDGLAADQDAALEELQPDEQVDAPETVRAASLQELIRTVDTGARLSREMECLAGAVYFESRGEPVDGQLAVARVVMNRASSDVFPDSYCDVVYQRKQFSFVRGGKMPRIVRGSAAWQRAKAIARIAHEGLWDSEAGDSLYFHARYVTPRWSRTKTRLAAIDTHIFYR